jgi:homoserine O-succinyltransferase
MPVHLVGDASSHDFFADAKHNRDAGFYESEATGIHIGLVNNMPDGALKATERQFLTLLDSASEGVVVHLSLYALPDVPRTESGRDHLSRFYSGIEQLWDRQLDGLIVTGAEPRTPNLTDEPYWGSLTKVIDWAEHHTHSTVWSCLAAHAALLHVDGIGRRRLGDKRFGVFEFARASDHQLTAGVPSPLRVPHSRWNDIPGNQLLDCGYRVLTQAKDGGVDAFVKQRKSLFLFFQGHPEYEANSLLLEYRRDVGRYLKRDRDTYPPMPEGYFDRNTADVLTALRERALSNRRKELFEDFPTALVEKRIANRWRSVSARLYGNWLAYLYAQSECRLKGRRRRKSFTAREVGCELSASVPDRMQR